MKRMFALSLVLLSLSTPARAVPITGYAMGTITENLSFAAPEDPIQPHVFTPGEAVYLVFTYDLDPPRPPFFENLADIEIALQTASGYHLDIDSAGRTRSFGTDSGGGLFLSLGLDPRTLELRFTGDAGAIFFSYDHASATEGFRASLVRAADASGFPAPEPSGLAMGLVGAALAGAGWVRRRVI